MFRFFESTELAESSLTSLTYICKIEPAKCQDEDGDVAHEFLVEDEEAAFAGPVLLMELG